MRKSGGSIFTREQKPKVFAEFDKGRKPFELFKSGEFLLAQRTLYNWFYEWQGKPIDPNLKAIRVDRELFERLSVYCEVHQLSKKQVAVRAIEIWLAQQEQPSEASPKKEAAPAKDAA